MFSDRMPLLFKICRDLPGFGYFHDRKRYTTHLYPIVARILLRIFFALFILIPLLEIFLLIKVGGIIGALPTVFMVVFTAVLGLLLLRHQGIYTVGKVQSALARGELPTEAMLEGVVLIISGAMLLTPGFFTDTIGFLGLIPALRRRFILAVLERGIISSMQHGPGSRGEGSGESRGSHTLEGDYRREDDD